MTKQVEAVHLLRSMTADDLELHLQEQRRRLFEVRFQQAAGQVENHRQVRELRREIARTMTLQLELARGHHLVSDLVEIEAPEAEPLPRRLGRRRASAEPVAEAEPEALEAEVEVEPEAATEPLAEKPRRGRVRRAAAPPVAETEPDQAPAEGAEAAAEDATGPDEEETDE